jgi:chromosome transmission fidelity protein 1
LKKEEILYFEANHIINKENVLVKIMKKDLGTMKDSLKFNFESFKNNSECNYRQILFIIEYFFDKVPGGIVVFLQNYEILSKLKNFLQEKSKLAKESLFFEEKINNTNTFSLYQAQIKRSKKAVIFGIIGGKLSEGINFNDELARCVIIFGLPYPSINSTDIKLKMEYNDYLYNKKLSEVNGKEYYENLCMKAVNQSIGRAIRHRNDYSLIVLADMRFCNERIMKKLPKWILDTKVEEVDDIEKFKGEMENFYRLHDPNN